MTEKMLTSMGSMICALPGAAAVANRLYSKMNAEISSRFTLNEARGDGPSGFKLKRSSTVSVSKAKISIRMSAPW